MGCVARGIVAVTNTVGPNNHPPQGPGVATAVNRFLTDTATLNDADALQFVALSDFAAGDVAALEPMLPFIWREVAARAANLWLQLNAGQPLPKTQLVPPNPYTTGSLLGHLTAQIILWSDKP
jgi:hypothetical protein